MQAQRLLQLRGIFHVAIACEHDHGLRVPPRDSSLDNRSRSRRALPFRLASTHQTRLADFTDSPGAIGIWLNAFREWGHSSFPAAQAVSPLPRGNEECPHSLKVWPGLPLNLLKQFTAEQ
jgi:hypothetical protein